MLNKKRLGICMLGVTPLNEILNVARVSEEVGILPIFLTKELKQLQKSVKKFNKIEEKRGV